MEAIGTTRFGEMCEVHEKTSPVNSTEQERTMPAVHLGTTGSPSGTHFFFNMQTGRVVRRHQWTPRPYSPSELKAVEQYARDAPETVVFADRRRVPIEDDDDATIATSVAGDEDEDDFEYPSIPVDSDDESGYDDGTYASSDDDDDSVGGFSDDEASTVGPSLARENRSEDDASADGSSQNRSEDDASTDGSSLGQENRSERSGDSDAGSSVADNDPATTTTRSGRPVRAPANLCPTALGGDYTTTRPGQVHATDKAAPSPDLTRHMLRARMGDHDSVAAIRDMHIAGEASKDDYAAALGCYKRMVDTSRYVRFESRAVNSFIGKPFRDPGGRLKDGEAAFHERMKEGCNAHSAICREQFGHEALVTFGCDDPAWTEESMAVATQYVMTQMSMKAAARKHGAERTGEAARTELLQLHTREAYVPVHRRDISREDLKNRLVEAIMTIKEKRQGLEIVKLKGRMVGDGRSQRGLYDRTETASPCVGLDNLVISTVIDAHEDRDVATVDLPGAYLSARQDKGDVVYMAIRGRLAELMVMAEPTVYRPFLDVDSKGRPVLYVKISVALYGLLKSALLFYRKLLSDLVSRGFEVNPYDPCVANKMVEGSQMTVRWHVDDLMYSHKNGDAISAEIKFLRDEYGDLRVNRGKIHEYLGMRFDFSTPGKVAIDMADFEQQVLADFSEDLGDGYAEYPALDNHFQVDETSARLPAARKREFHRKVAQLLFLGCRSRRDIKPATSFLTTRVQEPTEQDWSKLTRILRYLMRNPGLPLTLEGGDMTLAEWWVDAAFGTHPDYKSHTGACMTLGKGSVIDISAKQKVNADSSTTAELFGVHQSLPKVSLAALFLEAQGFDTECRLHQDNLSTVKLEVNGKRSSGQRTRHLHIKFFTITDHIEKGWVTVRYCPTAEMTADFFTKPLTGELFRKFRARIMNCPMDLAPAPKGSGAKSQQRSVGFRQTKDKRSTTPRARACPQECVVPRGPGRPRVR